MTNAQRRRNDTPSKAVLWLVTALLILAGSFASYQAFRANPYVSDAQRNGVSKWRFLETCKSELDQKLRTQYKAQLPPEWRLQFTPPVQRVESVTPLPPDAQNKNPRGWLWQSVALIRTPEGNVIGARFACRHDAATNKTEIVGIQPVQ